MASHEKRVDVDEDVDEGLGCGLLAKVTTEAYVKALKRNLPAFAAFFPAKSAEAYLMKVSVFDEEHDLLEPASKEDVTEAEGLVKKKRYADQRSEKIGIIPVVAFVEQVVDSENKSTDLLVMPPYDKPLNKGIKLLKKGEFTDLTLLVPVVSDSQKASENDAAHSQGQDDPLAFTTPEKTAESAEESARIGDLQILHAPKRKIPNGVGRKGKPRKLNFDDCVVDPEEREPFKNISMAVVESSKLIVDPESSSQTVVKTS